MKSLLHCTLTSALLLLAGVAPGFAADSAPALVVKHVDAAGAAKLLKDDPQVVVLDVRTPQEFSAGHLKGAKNLDFNAGSFAADLGKLDKNKTYLVHCAAGGRSTKSLENFKKLGFKSVVHLDGGLKAWEKAGQPVQK